MEAKRCGTCASYDRKKKMCKIRRKFVMKITPPCSNWKEKVKHNEQ